MPTQRSKEDQKENKEEAEACRSCPPPPPSLLLRHAVAVVREQTSTIQDREELEIVTDTAIKLAEHYFL